MFKANVLNLVMAEAKHDLKVRNHIDYICLLFWGWLILNRYQREEQQEINFVLLNIILSINILLKLCYISYGFHPKINFIPKLIGNLELISTIKNSIVYSEYGLREVILSFGTSSVQFESSYWEEINQIRRLEPKPLCCNRCAGWSRRIGFGDKIPKLKCYQGFFAQAFFQQGRS